MTAVENTAAAAQLVAQSERAGMWPPSPPGTCAELYGLHGPPGERPKPATTTTPASSASPRSWRSTPAPTSTSLMMTLPHKPGSLYSVLARFYALGINLHQAGEPPHARAEILNSCSTSISKPPVYAPRRRCSMLGEPGPGSGVLHVLGQLQRGVLIGIGIRPHRGNTGPQLFPADPRQTGGVRLRSARPCPRKRWMIFCAAAPSGAST